ncbi:DUF4199 domain-containing protein [Mucilaginibacter dorajii]|uniref:DUF4199 domain-containing protein n=1 Tax=Mucilaginibacter dorajii TaxID=692994 RepID=A0ABP7QLS5_9SPHI|nr:DUF4199 domain-containing protein [Mucilaginibacter dorajii]MCS3735914.1 hypothetical protein [Mucilaginibacter dorajii]
MTIDIKQLRTSAVTFGLILGIALVILNILSFYVIISTSSVIAISATPFIFSVLLPIALVIVLCFNLRKKIGGSWNFKHAATGIFIMFLAAFVVKFIVYDQLFTKVIEPNTVQKTETAMVNAVTTFLEKSNTSQDVIDKKMEEIQKQFDAQKNVTIGKEIQSIGISIIFMFVVAVIFAAFFKKEIHTFNPNLDNDPAV